MAAPVYEYDVFISYRREDHTVPAWVRTHFHPRLLELLDNQLDREARVFCDAELGVGTRWPDELKKALLHTRILVPVCSPKYFRDEWCLTEWHSMAQREAHSGGVRTLIYPVIFCDSKSFPPWAHERRMRDLRQWAKPYEHFQMSLDYLDFHSELTHVAEELADLLDQAPAWRPDWPVATPVVGPPPMARLPRF
ncbi:toll/interleukin-1 receptor domain-containing protein [Amycolatopsis magusensis]|uniref:toll/interleukin-1 receptor domain-containing protein n=1 Tax=Amycolatopsis magusensis TaxID=882444 RepID=UPI0037BD8E97